MKDKKELLFLNQFGKSKKYIKGFTFIELIISITILAILSVIGFILYISHLSISRDSVRKSDLSEIYSLLDSNKIKAPLIIPDKKIDLFSNGFLLGYQGYLSDNIINSIGFKGTGKDPIDQIFYTYYLTKDLRNAGVMGFLENNPNESSYINSKYSPFFPKVYAIDYSDRYPIIFGKKLGILVDENKIPIQEDITLQSTGKLEITTITSNYIAYLDNNTSISNSGYTMEILYGTALTGIIGNSCEQYIEESNGIELISGMYLINSSTGTYEQYCDMGSTTGSGENTRITTCSGNIPSNSYSSNGDTYIQRYNGTDWTPELSWAENQLIGCDFNCNNNYTWSGGINSCLQNINGVCGIANGSYVTTVPATGLCELGTATIPIGSLPWTWNCEAINGGVTATCGTISIDNWTLSGYAYSELFGWIDFSYPSGLIWGEGLGWIDLSSDTLSLAWDSGIRKFDGKVWSESIGWIDFNIDSTNQVYIGTDGYWKGRAWSETAGWIDFNIGSVH